MFKLKKFVSGDASEHNLQPHLLIASSVLLVSLILRFFFSPPQASSSIFYFFESWSVFSFGGWVLSLAIIGSAIGSSLKSSQTQAAPKQFYDSQMSLNLLIFWLPWPLVTIVNLLLANKLIDKTAYNAVTIGDVAVVSLAGCFIFTLSAFIGLALPKKPLVSIIINVVLGAGISFGLIWITMFVSLFIQELVMPGTTYDTDPKIFSLTGIILFLAVSGGFWLGGRKLAN